MLTALAVGIVILVIGAIAFGFVAREGRRQALTPPPPVFSLDEAYAWVVDRVPDEVAATLTPDDVKAILAAQVRYLNDSGAAVASASARRIDEPAVVDADAAVAAVIEATRRDDEEYLPEQVRPVIDALLVYMREIGAIAGPVD